MVVKVLNKSSLIFCSQFGTSNTIVNMQYVEDNADVNYP